MTTARDNLPPEALAAAEKKFGELALPGWQPLDPLASKLIARYVAEAAAPAIRTQAAAIERESIRQLAEEIGAMCPGCDAFRAFLEELRERGAS